MVKMTSDFPSGLDILCIKQDNVMFIYFKNLKNILKGIKSECPQVKMVLFKINVSVQITSMRSHTKRIRLKRTLFLQNVSNCCEFRVLLKTRITFN